MGVYGACRYDDARRQPPAGGVSRIQPPGNCFSGDGSGIEPPAQPGQQGVDTGKKFL